MRRLFNIFAISAIMVCFSCGQATNKQQEQQEADAFAEFNKQIEQEEQQKKQQEDDHEKSLYGYWKDSNGIIELFLNADEMFCVVDKELIYRGGWSVNYTGGVDADLADAYNGGLHFTAINEGTYTSLTPIWINIKLRKDSSKKKISWSRSSNRTLDDAIDAYNEKVQLAREKENARSCQSTRNSDYSSKNKRVSFNSSSDVMLYLSQHRFSSNGVTISIRYDGIYSNGQAITSAVSVEGFSGMRAVLSASSPYAGGARLYFVLDASRGTITDESGDVFYIK